MAARRQPGFMVAPAGLAARLIADLASRLANRVQITTDAHRPYIAAIESEFGRSVDYAMLIKTYRPRSPRG